MKTGLRIGTGVANRMRVAAALVLAAALLPSCDSAEDASPAAQIQRVGSKYVEAINQGDAEPGPERNGLIGRPL